MANSMVALLLIFGFSALVSGACDFSSVICSSAGFTCPSQPTFQTGNNTYGVSLLDVVSFNDATITNGDIQGRAAVRNNFYGFNGISVGDTLTDNLGYSLIVGGNLNWATDGAVYPLNKRFFVGGNVAAPSYITGAIDNCASLGSGSGCISSNFDSLSNYWTQFSSLVSTQTDNMVITYQDNHAILTCSASANTYFVHTTGAAFSQASGVCVVGCNANANFVFTINGDVTFQGLGLQASGLVLYNVVTGTITVSTSIYGNVVAPNSNLVMNTGTIYGTVVAGNLSNVVQINEGSCSGANAGSASSGSDSYCASLTGSPSASGSATASASGSASGSATASASGSASATASASGSASTVSASTTAASGSAIQGQTPASNNDNTSGASTMAISFVLAVIAALL